MLLTHTSKPQAHEHHSQANIFHHMITLIFLCCYRGERPERSWWKENNVLKVTTRIRGKAPLKKKAQMTLGIKYLLGGRGVTWTPLPERLCSCSNNSQTTQ